MPEAFDLTYWPPSLPIFLYPGEEVSVYKTLFLFEKRKRKYRCQSWTSGLNYIGFINTFK